MTRIVLLGASNLTIGFPEIAALAARGLGDAPVRLLAAAGHGRGYLSSSLVLGRGLPPIADCGLWRALRDEPALPTRALIADAGNDLAFGAGVDETLAAVGRCLERLATAGAETIVVLPPLTGIERLSRARFVVLRSLLFPGRQFGHGDIVRRLRRLASELRGMAERAGAHAAEHDPEWLGGDGIHVRWRRRRAAWSSLLAPWAAAPAHPAAAPRLRWSWRRAERASLLAIPFHRRQPCRHLADGSTLSCY